MSHPGTKNMKALKTEANKQKPPTGVVSSDLLGIAINDIQIK
jgi:hypothetical protein